MYAKYCSSISELQIFLLGKLNHEKEVSFEERFCDKECLKTMERMGIHVSGAQLDDKYPHYEKLEKTIRKVKGYATICTRDSSGASPDERAGAER